MSDIERIPLFDLNYGPEEEAAARRVLRGKWLTLGEETRAFEREFAEYVGAGHAVAVSSGSAALDLAVRAAGVGPGDEVICPALTFIATVNAVIHAGATPILADVCSLDDWTISPEDVARKITPRTKAIVVMHYGGFACRMDAIGELAREHGLRVIEDAAHAPGARFGERRLGAIGDLGCFSFFSNKNLAVGEGGMLCTSDAALAKETRLARSHGMSVPTLDRHQGRAYSYDVVQYGYNYRLDEIRAALGRVQLRRLDDENLRRAAAYAHYRERLADCPRISLPFAEHPHWPSYHILPVLLDAAANRKAFMCFMRGRGIQTSIHYLPVHQFTYWRENFAVPPLPVTEEIGRREVTLPLYPDLTPEQIDRVVAVARDFLRQ